MYKITAQQRGLISVLSVILVGRLAKKKGEI